MGFILHNPFAPAVIACAIVSAAFALALALTGWTWIGGIAPPSIFLVAYYETYQKVPDFPPRGAANKIFYVALASAVLFLAMERIPFHPFPSWAKALIASILGVVWIANAKLPGAAADVTVTAVAIALVGAAMLWRIDGLTISGADDGAAWALGALAAVAAILAPVALFGGSSTSVGLCLGTSVGLAILSIASFFVPRPLGGAGIFAAGAGLLGIVDAIALVSQMADLLALALAATSPFLAWLAIRRLDGTSHRRRLLVWLVSGLAALSPIAAIVPLLFLRHDSPL